ncbi:hypothetical protein BT96DRAFT_1022352 [Gymnopus androsaceus JB14]|uniref:Uncharacterized protein n=1 Tax=Gymnopus androsaceus JB14 TaxID=1447944 RepID=A0A6A4HAZ2_9AGAR|nr:hypothetical protein BT96DRAFT_1022352 [Gymnopus androsaceus JB14]
MRRPYLFQSKSDKSEEQKESNRMQHRQATARYREPRRKELAKKEAERRLSMPNPGNFKGARKAFLESVKEEFTQAVKDGDIKEEELDAVDDKRPPLHEANPEGWETMCADERGAVLKGCGDFVRAKNAQIARCLKYVYNRENKEGAYQGPCFRQTCCAT